MQVLNGIHSWLEWVYCYQEKLVPIPCYFISGMIDKIRLDRKGLDWVRKTATKKGLPYQSLINDILAKEMKRAR